MRCGRSAQLIEFSGAVAEAFFFDADALEQREEEVRHWNLSFVLDVSAGVEQTTASAGQDHRQILVAVAVGVAQRAAVDDHRVVEQRPLPVLNRVEFGQEVSELLHHVLIDFLQVGDLLGVVAVYATLLVPLMILTESFISFLGLGVQEPLTSWGALISEGAGTINYGTLWQLAFPLFFFVITLFAFFFVGDGLRDALDPKDR